MTTPLRSGRWLLPVLTLSVACARKPDVDKYTCTSSTHCPDGYVCTGSPGSPGRCARPDAATPQDGSGLDHGSADVSIGRTDSAVDGGGGSSDGAGATGGTWDGGGRGTGGVPATGGTSDAGPASGSGGSGGTVMTMPTGQGGAAGGMGLGGSSTAGVTGSGGSTVLAAGGSTATGTGGSTRIGTGGSTATGTGGSTPPGTGGSIPPGTGGSIPSGTGGSIPPGTGGSTPPGTGGSIPPGTGGTPGALVRLDQTKQTIDGFGINDTWYALTDAQARTLFDASTGLGLSILRVGMSPNGGFYNANEASSIASAKSYGATKIIGTTWSPPANCKDNNKTMDGGHLLASCYESWSTTITNFAKNNGLYAMSIANEPDFASCGLAEPCNGSYDTTLYTAKEMVAFLKVAGPKLAAEGIKVIAPETAEWIHLWSNTSATGSVPSNMNSSDPLKCGCFGTSTSCASACTTGNGYDYGHYLYQDATAWGLLDILGTHQYDTQVAMPWPSDVPRTKRIWVTEMAGIKWWPEQGPSTTIENGVAVARWIHDALTVGEASAWLWWWYNGSSTNEGLYVNGTDTKRHYTFGNYSRFVRPGYTRVDAAGTIPAGVLLSGYKGVDGTVVIVAINQGTATATFPVTISGGTAPASLVPWVTSADDNLIAKTAVTVSGGSFTATLAGKTVTTFVGQ